MGKTTEELGNVLNPKKENYDLVSGHFLLDNKTGFMRVTVKYGHQSANKLMFNSIKMILFADTKINIIGQ